MEMKWASNFCPNAKFFLKTDDDVAVNTLRLIDYLEEIIITKPNLKNTFFCLPHYDTDVRREEYSKHKVKFLFCSFFD